MKWLKSTYRSIADHLTKVIGAVGAAVMAAFTGLMGIDPESVHNAAQNYLGQNAAAKIGGALFVLVILRGWYTGMKAKKAVANLPPPAPGTVSSSDVPARP